MTVVVRVFGFLALISLLAGPGRAQDKAATIVYRCPGNVYTSSTELTPAMAEQRGCRVIEGAPITVIQAPKPRPAAASAPASAAPPAVAPSIPRRVSGSFLSSDIGCPFRLRVEVSVGSGVR